MFLAPLIFAGILAGTFWTGVAATAVATHAAQNGGGWGWSDTAAAPAPAASDQSHIDACHAR